MIIKKIVLAAMLLVSGLSVQAQEAAATASEKTRSEKADMLQVAGKLVKYGYQTKTALPLIQALQIYNQFNTTVGTETKTSESDKKAATTDQQTKNNPVSMDPQKLIADATTFAGSDKSLLALIKSSSTKRGARFGAVLRSSRVYGGYTDTWTISFRGGEPAYVVVSGDGDTDLDLYVYDENGNLIVRDTRSSDDCVVGFVPRWTGRFYVKVKNLGSVYNSYTLATN